MEGPYHPLRVAEVVDETADARSLVLDVPEALRPLFAYRPGQFLTFRVPVDGKRLVRCYSLASAPDVEGGHKVTVKRVAGGRVSNWMNESVRAGDVLEVMRPAGRFLLTGRDAEVVLFGAGSGITPVISILKSALAGGRRARLLYANRDRDSIIFRDEIAALERRYPDRLRVVHRLDVEHGFADAAAVRGFAASAGDADHYVCGPGPFMDLVERELVASGVPRERLFIERFEYAGDGAPRDLVAEPAAASVADGATIATIRLDGAERDVDVKPGETIVQAARRAGLEPPTSCEEGYCACCMARLREGAGEMKANDVLTPSQLAEGWVLTCQLCPTTKRVRIEYPD
ncbi:MAG TPA: ferredoxin--NADP reductase [Myxococcota bacterium]|nr:ferredoxin--NADP reductase [Myxococcota bacterium]HVH08147.1 ferredoxin--NADP reductase [Myxococcota bacterium]